MDKNEQYQVEYDAEVTQNSLLKALGLSVEVAELLNTAEMHNDKDELLGEIPAMAEETRKQVYKLKKMLGMPVDDDDTKLFSNTLALHQDEQKPLELDDLDDEESEDESDNPKETLNDSYGIVDLALNVLKAGEKDDDYGVQEAIKELTSAAMNYFAEVANQ